MNTIFGILHNNDVASILLEGLERFKLQNYESVGIATLVNGKVQWEYLQGEKRDLIQQLQKKVLNVSSSFGIAYTRCGNQSKPNPQSTYFYATDDIAVVHNGSVENYQELKEELLNLGYSFQTRTESELIAKVITRYIDVGLSPIEAISVAIMRLKGYFAIISLFAGSEEQLIAARRGNPLAIGVHQNSLYVSSDVDTLSPLSEQIMQLEEGTPAVLRSINSEVLKPIL